MQEESLTDLIQQAIEMYKDRPKVEGDLIYHIAKMNDEERSGLILGYEILYKLKDD